jgi:hypothetical protein
LLSFSIKLCNVGKNAALVLINQHFTRTICGSLNCQHLGLSWYTSNLVQFFHP